MNVNNSYFVVRLDDPGECRFDPVLELIQQTQLLRLFSTTAQALGNTLDKEFGVISRVMAVSGFLQSIVPAACLSADIAFAGRLITIQEYSAHRGYAPRIKPGGPVEKDNQKTWERLLPWLQMQLIRSQQQNVLDSLLWRCHLARIPEQLIASEPIADALKVSVERLELFDVQEIGLQLRSPTLCGTRWVRQMQSQALAYMQKQLDQQQYVIVELIRDCNALRPFGDLVLVVGSEQQNPFLSLVDYYHPDLGAQRLTLATGGDDVSVVEDTAQRQGLVDLSVKAFRVWRCAGETPPWFGVRRFVPTLLPWRIMWWIKHALARGPMSATDQ